MKPTLQLALIAFTIALTNAATAEGMEGRWALSVEDLTHKEVASLVVRFTEDKAPSCLGGDWKRVVVESRKTTDESFFPVSEPLSYRIESAVLTIGRNEVCDAYLHLRGPLADETVRGPYVRFGWGSEALGFFVLRRQKQSHTEEQLVTPNLPVHPTQSGSRRSPAWAGDRGR